MAAAEATEPAAPAGFSADRLVDRFEEINGYVKDVPFDPIMAGMSEILLLINALGSSFSFVTSDLQEKIDAMHTRKDELKERAEAEGGPAPPRKDEEATDADPAAPLRLTIQCLVADEKARNMHTGSKHRAARSMSRLLWFLDFTAILIRELEQHPEKSLSTAAGEAYNASVGPHHGWFLRKSIGAAMMLLPYRDRWLATLGEESGAVALEKLVRARRAIEPIREELWAFFRRYEVDNLP